MKRKIELYKIGKLDDITELERQRSKVKVDIDRIQAFIDTYGQENANLGEKGRLEERLADIEQKLADNSDFAEAIREINRLVENFVDNIIGSSMVTKFVYSQQRSGFEFNILKSHLETPANHVS